MPRGTILIIGVARPNARFPALCNVAGIKPMTDFKNG